MKIREIKQILDAEVCTTFPHEDREVFSACGADMMSDVLAAYSEDKGLLLTGLNNSQVVRTAEMIDIFCIVYVRGKTPDVSVIALAEEKEIIVMTTKHSMYTACGLLYAAGLPGGAPQ
jgi:predicted transcriptional regulator